MNSELKRRGLMYVLSSPSGAGKTTILKMILREILPDSGEVLFDELKIQNNLKYNRGFKPKVSKTVRYQTDLKFL